jgi:hypothetical protein
MMEETSIALHEQAQSVLENFIPDIHDLQVISLQGNPETNRQNFENLVRLKDPDARINLSQVKSPDISAASQFQAAAQLTVPKV